MSNYLSQIRFIQITIRVFQNDQSFPPHLQSHESFFICFSLELYTAPKNVSIVGREPALVFTSSTT